MKTPLKAKLKEQVKSKATPTSNAKQKANHFKSQHKKLVW